MVTVLHQDGVYNRREFNLMVPKKWRRDKVFIQVSSRPGRALPKPFVQRAVRIAHALH
jgi:hypothetical protein